MSESFVTVTGSKANPLILRLSHAGPLSDEDRAALARLCSPARSVGAGQDVIHHGDPPRNVHLVLDGIACHYKMMPDGGRAITALLLPGDFCDLHVAILGRIDHATATLMPCTLVAIPEPVIQDLTRNCPNLTRALWWASLVNEAILREWLASVGRRDALQRMAHFFCEMLLRLQAAGLAADNRFAFPLRQGDVADILGLTTVHLNRTLQDLRALDLIIWKSRVVEIPDSDRLQAFCNFDPTYLHLGETRDGGLRELVTSP